MILEGFKIQFNIEYTLVYMFLNLILSIFISSIYFNVWSGGITAHIQMVIPFQVLARMTVVVATSKAIFFGLRRRCLEKQILMTYWFLKNN